MLLVYVTHPEQPRIRSIEEKRGDPKERCEEGSDSSTGHT